MSTHSEEQKGEEAEAAEAQSERAAAGMATLSVGEDDDEFHDAQTETPPTSPTPRPGGGGTLQIGAKEFTPMALKPATEVTPAAAEVCGHPPQRDARGVWQPAHEHPPPPSHATGMCPTQRTHDLGLWVAPFSAKDARNTAFLTGEARGTAPTPPLQPGAPELLWS